MTKNSPELAATFDAKAREFAELVRGLEEEQWQAVCAAENWPVGTTAHHVGVSINWTWDVVEAMLAGNVPPISIDEINAMNSAHAAEFQNPDKLETLAIIQESSAGVTAAIAALDEDALNCGAIVSIFGPDPIPVRNMIEMLVIGHFGMHQPSIEAAIGA